MRNYVFDEEINKLKDKLIKLIEEKSRQGYVIDYVRMMKNYENIVYVDGEAQNLGENIPYLCHGEQGISLTFWECEEEPMEYGYSVKVPDYVTPKFFQYKGSNDKHSEDPLENVCIEILNVIHDYMILPEE